MANKPISNDVEFNVEFYDVDSMQIVWHGNYVKYMEVARCALLSALHYHYLDMEKSGYAWPVVEIKLKYIRSLRFMQRVRITATLLEYENCLKIGYVFRDAESGTVLNKAESMQMAIDMKTMESCFVSPQCFMDRVHEYIKIQEENADA